ncbi:hypothetical protein [Sulfurovum sp.]|uniref:hypothetical protein n=1 Tax=Sulfurovum sp. TaxID=1969726 RepID=UPI002867C8E2|nr:hypothetical protein [Sulfurovum sp.]
MKYANFFIFIISLSVLIFLQSYTHLSTSLLAILPDGESKEMIKTFNKTQNSKVLLLAVKGLDSKVLEEIQQLEKELTALPLLDKKEMKANIKFQKHEEEYKLFSHKINEDTLSNLDVSKALEELYTEMTTSFFPVSIDKIDPFKLLNDSESVAIKLKNGHLVLGEYGYLTVFILNSSTLEEHKELYRQIHAVVDGKEGVKLFSPLFYYVENSQAITSDVNNIMLIALGVLLLLYLLILRNVSLLFNTLMTLATSAIVATIVLTRFYDEVSIFVFVFGISISTVAIDYMFHHYLHGYYDQKYSYNREVLFGFLTTVSAFFILSFTSFLLIKQIAIFSIVSLTASYLHFSFLYPRIGFKIFAAKENGSNTNLRFLNAKIFFVVSSIIIIISPLWVHFDLNLKNLDYDNKTLKQTEEFFSEQLDTHKNMTFALKAESIDTLITHAQAIQQEVVSVHIPLASLLSRQSYEKNRAILKSMSLLKTTLDSEAEKIGFKKEYFKYAYDSQRPFIHYTQESIRSYGIDMVKVNGSYVTYGTVSKEKYQNVLAYDFVESLSIKERFEEYMRTSVDMLLKLGILALLVIILLLYYITKRAIIYAMIFLIFPTAMVSIYAYFTDINILHIFMLFVILSIGIDYAIYLSGKNDTLTKKAISYSLISTFAGLGVLVFSSVSALFSMGIVTTIGIVSIFVLLVFLKGVNHAS